MMDFSERLLAWYAPDTRALPWRGTRDPYRIWLSEIMLQQTQSATVKGYYTRFLEHYPNVLMLADAAEDDVLKLWEGLGYYSRARNLHKAAKIVAYDTGGVFPRDAYGLRALPGIGPYAGNAIASIAYNECVPALDGNQARVLTRWLAYDAVIKTPFDLEADAMRLISRERPGDYNQALMDLGATVCTPVKPSCAVCPLSGDCQAHRLGREEDYPNKPKPAEKKIEQWCIVAVFNAKGQVAVRKRGKGLLGGLYEFEAIEGHPDTAALTEALRNAGFEDAVPIERMPDSKHVFTHKIWQMQGWRAFCEQIPDDMRWIDREEMRALAFPSALRAYTTTVSRILR